jgi:hypothetical protein
MTPFLLKILWRVVMAALSNTIRAELHGDIMREVSKLGDSTNALKSEWRQLIDAADDFREANANAYNQTIPAGIRSKFTAAQKALALTIVLARQYNFERLGS